MDKLLSFRDHHLLTLLNDYEDQKLPLDLFVRNYFKSHSALGSKDRGEIAETLYALIRWQRLLDHLIGSECGWPQRLICFRKGAWKASIEDKSIPTAIRVSFPDELFEKLKESHGEEKAIAIALASNEQAPTAVRANLLKTTREKLIEKWAPLYDVVPCEHSKSGIIFRKKIALFTLPEFKEGLFEVQDEASQLVSQLVQVKPGDQVLDYCAGSGGKTLGFAPHLQGKGQVFLHDVRPYVLLEAKKRLKRAGIQNAQVINAEADYLKKLKKKMDWVLVDAPCSGTGTLRRNPDMKWKYENAMLERLKSLQRVVFEKALSYLKPDGKIVYATCSLLNEENEEQAAHFEKTYGLKRISDPFASVPSLGQMDGFYGIVLEKLR